MMWFGTCSSATIVRMQDDDNAILRAPAVPNRRVYYTVQVEIPDKLCIFSF